MACPRCGKKRGHLSGCDAATPTGRKSPQRGKGRRMGPGDIPRHDCVKEVENIRRIPHRTYVEKITYWRCRTCHVSMGSASERESRL